MEAFINQPFIAKREKIAKYCTWGGMAALLVGLFMAQRDMLAAYICLLVGMGGAMVGAYYTSTYVREPRADQVFTRLLESLDKRYALYCYYLPSNMVVLSHYGLTVLLPKAQKGQIIYRDGRWQHKGGARKLLQLVGEPGLGNPEKDLQTEVDSIKEWVTKNVTEFEVPVQGIVVFTHPEAVVDVSDAPIVAIPAVELPEYFKVRMKGQTTLSTANQKELRRKLDAIVASVKRP